ncbi:MAG: selenium metabolism-associated LysR family transcriptional regulator [Pseudomonadota bacterium]|nr:LysR family transcriptional regulator [Pseudomonadota bacterium]
MDLWQLNIFCKVIELKSFSKAGETAHISQPTVSSHIRDLESHFGCRLIDRMSKEAVPTKAGQLVYAYAKKLIALRDEMEIALSEFHGIIKGNLIIGGSTIPGEYILPRIVGSFAKIYPEIMISLIIGDTEKIINDTISGTLELGVVGAEKKDKRIHQEILIDDEMRLIIPSDHIWGKKKSIGIKMLLEEPFIVRERGSGTLKSIEQNLNKIGYDLSDLKIAAQMGSTEAVRQGIKSKAGVSILSTIAVEGDLKDGSLKALAIEGLNLKRSFYLTTSRQRSISPVCSAFITHMKKESGAKK